MSIPCLRPVLASLALLSLPAWALDTWVLADGRMFEAQVKGVTPGTVLFTMRTGADQPLEITKLSERSKKQLIELLGLGATAVTPVAPMTAVAPAPATPPPAATPAMPATPAPGAAMVAVARDPNAVDAKDEGSLEANFGLATTVVGKVKRVATLGSSGHKLLEFEGTDFNVFINRRQAEQPGWDFENLPGKTVQAKGKISKYNEKLQIQLNAPSELSVVQ